MRRRGGCGAADPWWGGTALPSSHLFSSYHHFVVPSPVIYLSACPPHVPPAWAAAIKDWAGLQRGLPGPPPTTTFLQHRSLGCSMMPSSSALLCGCALQGSGQGLGGGDGGRAPTLNVSLAEGQCAATRLELLGSCWWGTAPQTLLGAAAWSHVGNGVPQLGTAPARRHGNRHRERAAPCARPCWTPSQAVPPRESHRGAKGDGAETSS